MERRRDIEDIIRRAGRVLADAEAVRVAEAALEAAIDNFRGIRGRPGRHAEVACYEPGRRNGQD